MKTLAAENHYHWQVEVGCQIRNAAGSHIDWNTSGYGCLVHPRIVLTTNQVWGAAENATYRQSEVMVRVGETEYPCTRGYCDEERNLAALVLAHPADNTKGKPFKSFPAVAENPPKPGQALGVLVKQHLYSQEGTHSGGEYTCYTFGYVSLLRGEDELLFALSGVEAMTPYFGNVLFDEDGKIHGVAVDFLRTSVETGYGKSHNGFMVFSPIYTLAKATKQLASKEAQITQ